MVASRKALEASADYGIAKVFAKFDSLINEAIAITEICRLRGAEVNAEALG